MERRVVLTGTSLAVSAAAGIYGGTTTLTAHLTSGANNLSGELVDFHIGSTDLGVALTNSNGIAQIVGVALPSIHAGSYTGDVSASFAGDVALTYAASSGSGNLSVAPAPLTIAADHQTKVYGASLPTLTVSYTGFVNGETSANLTKAPTVTTTASAGSKVAGNPYSITASGAVDADYAITYVGGTLVVTPAPVSVAAASPFKDYGQANPALTGTIFGLVNGDQVSASFTTTATTQSGVVAGGYPINLTGLTGADAGNYKVAAAYPGVLTVNPATLIVQANNQVKSYIGPMPTLTATYTGFVNGDGPQSLSSPVTLSTTATATSAPGSYAINATGGSSANYTVVALPGTLRIQAATSSSGAGTMAFVTSLYKTLLGRTPDSAGVALWTGELAGGISRLSVARSIYQTGEAGAFRAAHPGQRLTLARAYGLALTAQRQA